MALVNIKRGKRSNQIRTREISSLDKTQKEPHGQQPSRVVARRGGGRDDAPHDHAGGKVQGRLAELVEEQVGGDLHQQVAHKQDGHGRLVLGRRQAEVLLQPGQLCRRDVVPVCWLVSMAVKSSAARAFPLLRRGGPTLSPTPRGEKRWDSSLGRWSPFWAGEMDDWGQTNLSM